MKNKKKWGLAFALAIIFLAPNYANATPAIDQPSHQYAVYTDAPYNLAEGCLQPNGNIEDIQYVSTYHILPWGWNGHGRGCYWNGHPGYYHAEVLTYKSFYCDSGELVGSRCRSYVMTNPASVLNTSELSGGLFNWITTHLLILITSLLGLTIAISLGIRAVRKYAKA